MTAWWGGLGTPRPDQVTDPSGSQVAPGSSAPGGPNLASVTITFSATAPANPRLGDLWYDSAAGYQLNQWDGTAWVPYQYGTEAISAGSITAGLLAAGIVYAGIVNGTVIEGATFIATPAAGEPEGMFLYSGPPGQNYAQGWMTF